MSIATDIKVRTMEKKISSLEEIFRELDDRIGKLEQYVEYLKNRKPGRPKASWKTENSAQL